MPVPQGQGTLAGCTPQEASTTRRQQSAAALPPSLPAIPHAAPAQRLCLQRLLLLHQGGRVPLEGLLPKIHLQACPLAADRRGVRAPGRRGDEAARSMRGKQPRAVALAVHTATGAGDACTPRERPTHLCRPMVGKSGWPVTLRNAVPRCCPFLLQHSSAVQAGRQAGRQEGSSISSFSPTGLPSTAGVAHSLATQPSPLPAAHASSPAPPCLPPSLHPSFPPPLSLPSPSPPHPTPPRSREEDFVLGQVDACSHHIPGPKGGPVFLPPRRQRGVVLAPRVASVAVAGWLVAAGRSVQVGGGSSGGSRNQAGRQAGRQPGSCSCCPPAQPCRCSPACPQQLPLPPLPALAPQGSPRVPPLLEVAV